MIKASPQGESLAENFAILIVLIFDEKELIPISKVSFHFFQTFKLYFFT